MSKAKQEYTHQSVKLSNISVDKVRERVEVTRQSISGFIEIAIEEKLANDLGPVTNRVGPQVLKSNP